MEKAKSGKYLIFVMRDIMRDTMREKVTIFAVPLI